MVDVLIAGAGPAGSIAAIRLARAGARVLLVDRARFPRDKLCGDTLNPGALRLLDGAGLRARVEAVSRPLEGMLITGNGGVHVRGTYGPGLFARALTPACARSAARGRRDRRRRAVPGRRPRATARSWTTAGGRPTVRGAVLCRTGGAARRASACRRT